MEHKFQKGFSLLALGRTDSYSVIPVGFNMLSSVKRSNRYQDVFDNIDQHTDDYKTQKENMLPKTEAAVLLIKNAIEPGIFADYVLDTWFTIDPMIQSILKLGINVIGMVKQLKQCYYFCDKLYTLPKLQKFINYGSPSDILGSLHMITKKEFL